MLLALILIPLLAAIAVALSPRTSPALPRLLALAATGATFVISVMLFLRFDIAGGMQFEQTMAWVPSLGLRFHVGVDGLNIGLVLMGCIVAFAATAVSWDIQRDEKGFYSLLLAMIGGILGAFVSQDLFWLYFFHELALIPTFLMIGVWGRGEDKNYATFNITMYLTLGALIALSGLILLYLQMPLADRTFDIQAMTKHFQLHPIAAGDQNLIFGLLMFGFGILVSLWPFHTWAPLGYGAAPTANAMLHAGVLKKFGLYGLIRIALPMLPAGSQRWLPVLALLCMGNLVYCGWVAMRQRNLNGLIGNSSVAHMGFCFLGIASLTLVGVTGAVLVMIAHGLLAALSFGLSGYLYSQTGTLDIPRLGGLLRRLPFIGAALMIALFAGCGVPGFANFAGELMVLFGAWKSGVTGHWMVVAAAWAGLIIGAVYMLRAIRNMLHGPEAEGAGEWIDAIGSRRWPYALLIAALVLFGVAPGLLTDAIKPSAEAIVKMASSGKANAVAPAAPLLKAASTH
ncbi:MAG: NADH-quinone oxidoreductase subunit M [Verrucomicrobia bacterium]|nr:NADH-quinone oxidoreductase subunit M [Verrucomicrobiota bacterium]